MELAGFIERIDRWGSVAPDRVADVSGDRTLTYRELVTRSDAMAAFLAAGVPDDRSPVVVLGHKEPEMLIAFLGAIKSGHPYVPVDTATPAQRVEKVRLAAGASLVVTPEQVSQATAAPAAAPRGIRPIGPDEPFYIIFTSGSTGEPKGVVITPDCLIGFIEWMIDWHRLPEGGEVILNQASFAFDVSVMDAYLVLLTGNTMFSLRREEIASPQELFAALSASNTTIWSSTPSLVEMCLAERRFAQAMLPRLRRFVLAGEALPPDVALALIERFPRAEVVNAYGPTEATVLASTVTVDRAMIERYDSLPIGVPRPNERMLIVDEERRPLPQGERGEIVITGPNVSPGYLGRMKQRSMQNWGTRYWWNPGSALPDRAPDMARAVGQ